MMAKAKKYNTSSFSSSSGDGGSNGSAAGETTTTVAYSSSHDSASSGSSSAHSSINNNDDNINHANVAQKMPGQSLTIRPLWRNGEKTFPYKVYDMLEFAEASGNNNICSWSQSGNSFVIHNRDLFIEFILPRFFLHKNWRSFVSIYSLLLPSYLSIALTHLLIINIINIPPSLSLTHLNASPDASTQHLVLPTYIRLKLG